MSIKYGDKDILPDRIDPRDVRVTIREDRLIAMKDRIAKLEKVVEAARGVGMNWKMGAPFGLDALDHALAELDKKECWCGSDFCRDGSGEVKVD